MKDSVKIIVLIKFCLVVFTSITSLYAQDFVVGYGVAAWNLENKEVICVTNLNDKGPGSLREAVSSGNRIILFNVSGKIVLERKLLIDQSDIVVAAFTAPDQGITLEGNSIIVAASRIALVGLKLRIKGEGDLDGIGIFGKDDPITDILVAHCSILFANDEGLTSNGRKAPISRYTFAYNISMGLNRGHSKGIPHSAGGLQSKNNTDKGSWILNLMPHNSIRNPRIEGGYADVINNVVYNYGNKGIESFNAKTNIIGNFIKRGPTNGRKPGIALGGGEAYIGGNNNNEFYNEKSKPLTKLHKAPFKLEYDLSILTAKQAYDEVLLKAGWKRDQLDNILIEQVRLGTGKRIFDPKELGGYPETESNTTVHHYNDIEAYLRSFFESTN